MREVVPPTVRKRVCELVTRGVAAVVGMLGRSRIDCCDHRLKRGFSWVAAELKRFFLSCS